MNGIGRNFLNGKPLCGFLAIDLHKQINGGLALPFFSFGEVVNAPRFG